MQQPLTFTKFYPEGLGFDPRPDRVGFMKEKVVQESVFLYVSLFSFTSIILPVFHTHASIKFK